MRRSDGKSGWMTLRILGSRHKGSGLILVISKVIILQILSCWSLNFFLLRNLYGHCNLTLWHFICILVSFIGLWLGLGTRTSNRRNIKKQFSISIRVWRSIVLLMFWRSVNRCGGSLFPFMTQLESSVFITQSKSWFMLLCQSSGVPMM